MCACLPQKKQGHKAVQGPPASGPQQQGSLAGRQRDAGQESPAREPKELSLGTSCLAGLGKQGVAINGATVAPVIPASMEGYAGATPAEQIANAAAKNQ